MFDYRVHTHASYDYCDEADAFRTASYLNNMKQPGKAACRADPFLHCRVVCAAICLWQYPVMHVLRHWHHRRLQGAWLCAQPNLSSHNMPAALRSCIDSGIVMLLFECLDINTCISGRTTSLHAAAEKKYLIDVVPEFFARNAANKAKSLDACSRAHGRIDFLHAPLFATHGKVLAKYVATAAKANRKLVVLSYVGVWTKVRFHITCAMCSMVRSGGPLSAKRLSTCGGQWHVWQCIGGRVSKSHNGACRATEYATISFAVHCVWAEQLKLMKVGWRLSCCSTG